MPPSLPTPDPPLYSHNALPPQHLTTHGSITIDKHTMGLLQVQICSPKKVDDNDDDDNEGDDDGPGYP